MTQHREAASMYMFIYMFLSIFPLSREEEKKNTYII